MKNKFLCLTQISLLCGSLFVFGCNKNEESSSNYREVSYQEFKIAAEKTKYMTSPFNGAQMFLYDDMTSRYSSPINYGGKFLLVDNEWKSYYSMEFEQNVLRYFSHTASNILEHVEKDYDNAYFNFYLSDNGFFATADYYDEYAEISFNIYGQMTSLNVISFDEYHNLDGTIIALANYYVDTERFIDTETLAVKDMCFAYLEEDDSYHFVGYNQHIRPKKIKIPDSYNDEVHGKKDVVDIDMYSIVRNSCVETLEFGYNIANINTQRYYSNNCGLKEFIVNSPNQNYLSIDGVLYSADKTVLIMCPPKKECDDYIIDESTIRIGDYAFYNCLDIHNVTLSDNITNTGFMVFANCGIQNLVIPSSIQRCWGPFVHECPNLESLTINNTNSVLHSDFVQYCDNLKDITINTYINQLYRPFIYECYSLETIHYVGTIEEWNNIYFYGEWGQSISDVMVVCSDGTIPLI